MTARVALDDARVNMAAAWSHALGGIGNGEAALGHVDGVRDALNVASCLGPEMAESLDAALAAVRAARRLAIVASAHFNNMAAYLTAAEKDLLKALAFVPSGAES